MEGQRAAKGLSGGGPCFKRNARLTHLPSKLSCQGSTSSRAPCRSSRHSPRLRSSPSSSSSLVVSRSQGSQEASLAPRPTSRTPSRCPSDHRSVKATRVSTASRSCVFLVCVFWLSLLRVFQLCYSSSFWTTAALYRSCAQVEYLAGRDPGNVQTEISISGALVVPRASQRKRITNIARDGEGVRGVPRSVALRRRRVKVGSSGDHLMPPSKPFSRHARRRSGVVFFPNDDEVL